MKKSRLLNKLFEKGDPVPFLFLIGTLIAALATVTLRTLALFLAYEEELGYFSSFSLPVAFLSILLLALLFLAFFSYEARSHFAIPTDYRDLPTLFSAALSAVIFPAAAALRFSSLGTGVSLACSILMILASFVSLLFFLFRIFRTEAESDTLALLTLAPAFATLFSAAGLYFIPTLMLNDPNKLLSLTAFSLAALFFLGETRIALGRKKTALHTFTTLATLLFSATAALPDLIYEGVKGTAPLGETALAFLLLAVFLYTLARATAIAVSASEREAAESALDFALGQSEPVATAEEKSGQLTLTFPEAAPDEETKPEEGEEEEQISLTFPSDEELPPPYDSES